MAVSIPKISIIVPVYNTGKYLEKCLDSLVNQTFSELEIIVVNDGSTDDSQNIIEEYSAKYQNIKSFEKTNGGLSDTRNYGLDKALGEFIGFVDSDDYVDTIMFEKMYNKAIEHQADIVLCDLEKVNEKGESFRELPQSPQLSNKIILKEDLTLFGEMACFACNKLFKKTLFTDLRFKKGIHFEDIELIPQLVLKSNIIAKINQPFYKYFERQNSITKTHTKKGLDMFVAIESVKKAFLESKYKNNKVELERFLILQGYYSYMAYVAYVKDKSLKKNMLRELNQKFKEFEINRWKIAFYKRFGKNYILSLPIKKQVYYFLTLIHRNLVLNIKA
ncbi:MAG: glycosyltransferase family 2 protein [Moheibacter sp.]